MKTWKYNYPAALKKGIFQGRFKRFFAQIDTEDGPLTAHLPNTGSLKSVNNKGQPCLYSLSDNPARKLAGTLEAIQCPSGTWVGINTQTPNRMVKLLLENKLREEWTQFENIKAEYKISKESRLDFALWNGEDGENCKKHFIEVKNVTLLEKIDGLSKVMFPDSVTERGQKHLRDMMRLMSEGHTCELLYFIQRSDGEAFSAAKHIDPQYAELLAEAVDRGMKLTPIKMSFSDVCLDIDLQVMKFLA